MTDEDIARLLTEGERLTPEEAEALADELFYEGPSWTRTPAKQQRLRKPKVVQFPKQKREVDVD